MLPNLLVRLWERIRTFVTTDTSAMSYQLWATNGRLSFDNQIGNGICAVGYHQRGNRWIVQFDHIIRECDAELLEKWLHNQCKVYIISLEDFVVLDNREDAILLYVAFS